jgi:hypothetical protein
MQLDPGAAELQSLLEAPAPATLTLRREDGEAITSPVWSRVHGDAVEVVVRLPHSAARAWNLADTLP